MGIVVNQSRLIHLTYQRTNLSFEKMRTEEVKTRIQNQLADLNSPGDSGGHEYDLLHQKQEKLRAIDQKLNQALEKIQTLLGAINEEVQSIRGQTEEQSRLFNYTSGVSGG